MTREQSGCGGTNLTGLLLGGGIEYAFAPNWSAKLEYDHIGYLSRNVDLSSRLSANESAPPTPPKPASTTNSSAL
jgi:opacity protein-like surface antigen